MQSITNAVIGTYAPDFELPGTDQAVHHLARYLERHKTVGIVFLSNVCPQVLRDLPRLLTLQSDLADQGFTLIGINSNDTVQSPAEGLEEMAQFAQTHGLTFPYLRDVTQDVAQTFGVSKTPEAFLLDQEGIIRYQGRPYGDQNQAYLREGAIAVLNGNTIQTPETQAVGSDLLWR